jgi:hypothetical protein
MIKLDTACILPLIATSLNIDLWPHPLSPILLLNFCIIISLSVHHIFFSQIWVLNSLQQKSTFTLFFYKPRLAKYSKSNTSSISICYIHD